ncbi:MAG: DUF1573 domain-containing protein [Bacteroidaceae bacterium]|nr:DUF1573 domain-containing protein [Bacteroidaceae bacterium]
MTTKRIYLVLLLVFGLGTMAGRAQIVFDRLEHDFGQIIWYNKARLTLTVTNKGTQAASIQDMRASSSTISMEWPKSSIPAGGQAQVTLEMDCPTVGHFDKAVHLYGAEGQATSVLRLKGNVVMELQEEHKADDYPYHVGHVYLSTDNIEFDEVGHGEFPQQVIGVYNAGSDVLLPELMHLPNYLHAEPVPSRLLPGRAGKLVVTLHSDQLPSMGLTQTTVYASRFPGDKVGKDNEVSVSVVLIPAFDTLSVVQKELAPELLLKETTLTLPPFKNKKKVKGQLLLGNGGKSSLQIKSLQVFNPAISVSLPHSTIAPGRQEKLGITVNREFIKSSHSRLRVLMITNDPKHPKVILDVKTADN